MYPPAFPRPSIERMNLLYHCCPLGTLWRENVSELGRWINRFTGRRVCAVAHGTGLETDQARAWLERLGCECFEVANDPRLGIAVSFTSLLDRIRSTDEREASFYAHSKGVTRPAWLGVRLWMAALYRENLGRFAEAIDALRTHAVAGSFRRLGRFPDQLPDYATWHYSGAFFYFRHDCVFRHPLWRDDAEAALDPYYVEYWPPKLFRLDESCCLFADEMSDPYFPPLWEELHLQNCIGASQ
jgi:hypothetical protein